MPVTRFLYKKIKSISFCVTSFFIFLKFIRFFYQGHKKYQWEYISFCWQFFKNIRLNSSTHQKTQNLIVRGFFITLGTYYYGFPLIKFASQTSSACCGFLCYVIYLTSYQPIYYRRKAFDLQFCWFLGVTGWEARQGSNIINSLKNLARKGLLVFFNFPNFISGCLY